MLKNKRKRERIPSLNLDQVLHSVKDDNAVDFSTLQTALASTDLRELVKHNEISEDLVLLWIVSKIGFLNTVQLKKCIAQVRKAMLTHRTKCILEEFNTLTNNSIDDAELYINLLLSHCPIAICKNDDLEPIMQRYIYIYMLLNIFLMNLYLGICFLQPHYVLIVPEI